MSVLLTLRRYLLALTALMVVAWSSLYVIDLLVSALPRSMGLNVQTGLHIGVILVASAVVIVMVRRLRSTLSKTVGSHMAVLFTFFMVLITVIATFFAVLETLSVPPDTLLLGGGIVSIVIGLVVSTLFGNIISGALMLTTYPFRIGDIVLVNNIPGRIEEITSLYTRISSNSGSDTVIPNSAIVSGATFISRLPTDLNTISTRLHFSVGERIYTSYIGGEGKVMEITPYSTRVLLDSGKDAVIPNTSIFTGMVQIARLREADRSHLSFQFRVSWDAEKVIAAMKSAASDKSLFLSSIQVEYSSLDGNSIELTVSAQVDPSRREEARSLLIRAAYLAMPH
jgi:small-conductance mechanosensitive channel